MAFGIVYKIGNKLSISNTFQPCPYRANYLSHNNTSAPFVTPCLVSGLTSKAHVRQTDIHIHLRAISALCRDVATAESKEVCLERLKFGAV